MFITGTAVHDLWHDSHQHATKDATTTQQNLSQNKKVLRFFDRVRRELCIKATASGRTNRIRTAQAVRF